MDVKKRKSLSLNDRIQILDKLEKAPPELNQLQLAKFVDVPRTTLQKLQKNKDFYRENCSLNISNHLKRKRDGKDKEVEDIDIDKFSSRKKIVSTTRQI